MDTAGAMHEGRTAAAAKRRSVAIVGGGIAGLACALAAAQAGAEVRVHEARTQLAPSAAHVDVVPNMLRGLVQLGVGDACVRAGFPYRRTSLVGPRGQALFSLAGQRLAGDRYPASLGITQAALQALLADAAVQQGVRIRRGDGIARVEPDAQGRARLQADDGTETSADVAVLACGADAPLRSAVFQAEPLAGAPVRWLWLQARRPRGLDDALLAVTARGDKAHVVPLGGSTVGVRISCMQPLAEIDMRAAARLLARFPAPVATLADHLLPDLPPTLRGARTSVLAPDWWRGPLLAVGDCAHALPPQFGQAAAQAVEDAVVLGQELARGADLGATASAFLQRRVPRVQQVMAIVTQAARWDAAPARDTDWPQLARALDELLHAPA